MFSTETVLTLMQMKRPDSQPCRQSAYFFAVALNRSVKS